MAIYKVYSYETRNVAVEYTVEADSDGEAVDAVQQLAGMSETEAARYVKSGPILEVEIEETDDAPSYQDVHDVGYWGER